MAPINSPSKNIKIGLFRLEPAVLGFHANIFAVCLYLMLIGDKQQNRGTEDD